VNRNDIDLEKIEKNSEEKTEEKDEEIKDVTTSKFDGLIKFMKEILGSKVEDVKISKKLTSSPVCLAVGSGSMDMRLERFLLEQKQIQAASAKIFEINSDHKIIKSLNEKYLDETKKDEVKDATFTLFDLACIIEDEPIKDAKDFSRRLQSLMG
jgi:molecular chaperone HtpG